jgi:pantetheine-phosphate adenylyltransferase
MFSADERLDMIRASTGDLPNVTVRGFTGLLVDFCKAVDAGVIVRGLRATADFDHEFMIGMANMDMVPSIQTVFLLARPQNQFISSSLIKEIAINGGDVTRYLPAPVLRALTDKLATG